MSISSVKDTYDAAGNIVSGGVTLHFGQVEGDKSDYKEYTYAVIAYYYCQDEIQPQSPPCVQGIHEAAQRIRLVKSIAGEFTSESYDVPRESARKRRSTDPNVQK